MPVRVIVKSEPWAFTIIVPVGSSGASQSVTFHIPPGNWTKGWWHTEGIVTAGRLPVQYANVSGGANEPLTLSNTSGPYNGDRYVSDASMAIINSYAGKDLAGLLTDQRGVPPDVALRDDVYLYEIILEGTADGGGGPGDGGKCDSPALPMAIPTIKV